ncbi:putative ribonuclease H-like domain-containing protein [Tanacetum coccineum]|uniref:Ribonuclease H-like domain-containing protein n=1 Tax=Tanacetum coccineum TaxID=301880 RepID=A0ABQ4XMR2_9ASTR
MNEFCAKKELRESIALQGSSAKWCCRKERIGIFIEDARTMLADSLLTYSILAEAVNTALAMCLIRVLVTNLNVDSFRNFDGEDLPHSVFMRPFGMSSDYTNYPRQLGKLIGQSQKKRAICSGYSTNSKDLSDQQFIVHTRLQPMHPEERTAAKDIPLSSEEQALHDELMNLMHQESLAKAHNDDQRIAFEEEKRRISIAKGERNIVHCTFTLKCKRKQATAKLHKGYRNKNERSWIMMNVLCTQLPEIEGNQIFLAFASLMGSLFIRWMSKSAFLLATSQKKCLSNSSRFWKILPHTNSPTELSRPRYRPASSPTSDGMKDFPHFLLKALDIVESGLLIKLSSMVKDFEDLMQKEFKMSSMGELTFFLGLQVKQSNGGIFLSQDKYVKDILNKFDFRTIKPASTPIDEVYNWRVFTPKVSHLHAVKRIFRYLKHQPKLGLWYPKDSPFHLEAFSDSDYAGDNHDRRSTSGGCQYLGRRLVSWQCKKQTIVAISSTEAIIEQLQFAVLRVLKMQNHIT